MKNAIHMLKSVTDIQMNSFLIVTPSGKVIAIDGGHRQDATYFLSYLREVTGKEIPHIDAWFLTHPHNDHNHAFICMLKNAPEEVSVDTMVYAFPHPDFLREHAPREAAQQQEFEDARPEFEHFLTRVGRGDRFSCGDFAFEVVYANDEPCAENPGNNSSTVYRVEVMGTTVLFPGDMGCEAEERILDCPEKLKADIVQMSHHGQEGLSKEVYALIAPKLCLWPTPDWLWVNDAGKGPGTGPWKTPDTRRWMEELNVSSHLVTKDGDSFVRFLGEGRFTFGRWQ